MTIQVNELWTAIAALATILMGASITRRVPLLARYNIPPAVTGGLIVALVLGVLSAWRGVQVDFADTLRNALLLVFFAAVGFSAKLRRIASGGRAVLAMCALIAVLAVLQSGIGVALATAFGKPPGLGVFVGGVSFLGGHGTTVAWAESELAAQIPGALDVGLVCATLGLVAGAIVAGVVGTRLAERAPKAEGNAPPVEEQKEAPWPEDVWVSERWLRVLLWMAAAIGLGLAVRPFVMATFNATVPAFLTVLLSAVVLTNVADLARLRIDSAACDLIGTLALRVFLAIAMMGIRLSTVGAEAGLIVVATLLQVVLAVALAVLIVYPVARGRDGAVAAGGFIGVAIGAMPVSLAAMNRLMLTYGPAPRAFLAVSLAGALFTDTANALVVQTMLTWFGPPQ